MMKYSIGDVVSAGGETAKIVAYHKDKGSYLVEFNESSVGRHDGNYDAVDANDLSFPGGKPKHCWFVSEESIRLLESRVIPTDPKLYLKRVNNLLNSIRSVS